MQGRECGGVHSVGLSVQPHACIDRLGARVTSDDTFLHLLRHAHKDNVMTHEDKERMLV